MKWLHDVSKYTLHYTQVFDALAQHHPEYVSLAWGSIKFVLMGVIQYAELTERLSEALASVGYVLSEVKLSSQLYPTDQMLEITALLYEHILNLFLRTAKWYTSSTAGRIARSFAWPFKLEYEDILDKIREYSEYARRIASGESKIELRSIYMELRQMGTDVQSIRRVVQDLQGLHPKVDQVIQTTRATHSLGESIKEGVDSTASCVAQILHLNVLNELKPPVRPEDSLRRKEYTLRRSERQMGPSFIHSSVMTELTQWKSSPASSLLVLQPGSRATAATKDLVVNVVSLIKSQQYNVLWSFSQLPSAEASPSPEKVLKSLVYQVLRKRSDALAGTADEHNIAKLGDDHTPTEWLDLLARIIPRLGKCFIVVEGEDLHRLSRGSEGSGRSFIELFRQLLVRMQTQGVFVKILVVDFGRDFNQCTREADEIVATVRRRMTVPPNRRRTVGQVARSSSKIFGVASQRNGGASR
ncbi:hypothetical protein BK809_0006099 [Diplodia seriata]|uniref:DUF7708 domain-containing protein n=1 Tax=Diplodia seriata TaxID=420778 RepID=A0A1S8B3N9_9PEZI|nr:hypothetical protein BK809_0006099 [Diplodia seriata]